MNFEALGNFEWYNDPENVRFEADGMVIYARSNTDFWQSIHRGFKKDDAHFFFCRKDGDFCLTLKWNFEMKNPSSQCGIMLRIDERNWFKASVMQKHSQHNILMSSLTNQGHSDWAGSDLQEDVKEIWFRLERVEDDYTLYYSLDNINFVKVRTFFMQSYEDVKVGAYIAHPDDGVFFAELSDLNLN